MFTVFKLPNDSFFSSIRDLKMGFSELGVKMRNRNI